MDIAFHSRQRAHRSSSVVGEGVLPHDPQQHDWLALDGTRKFELVTIISENLRAIEKEGGEFLRDGRENIDRKSPFNSTQLRDHPCVEVRINAAALIEAAVAGVRSPELRARVSGAGRIFEGIVSLLQDCAGCPHALKAGARAAFALRLMKPTRHQAVAAGAVAALVDRLGDLERGDAERALVTIELLCLWRITP
ncbi:hypothetical protein NL676_038754 [Syzygium grande]|nr:hypothetical protein NL676_038754 [Syzygium grande]